MSNLKKIQKIALTGGIVWGATIFLTTLASVYWGYGTNFLNIWTSIYPGYNITLGGSIIGFIYGFLDLYIGVYIINWVYRKVVK